MPHGHASIWERLHATKTEAWNSKTVNSSTSPLNSTVSTLSESFIHAPDDAQRKGNRVDTTLGSMRASGSSRSRPNSRPQTPARGTISPSSDGTEQTAELMHVVHDMSLHMSKLCKSRGITPADVPTVKRHMHPRVSGQSKYSGVGGMSSMQRATPEKVSRSILLQERDLRECSQIGDWIESLRSGDAPSSMSQGKKSNSESRNSRARTDTSGSQSIWLNSSGTNEEERLDAEERLCEIREIVNLDKKPAGQNSHRVLAIAIPEGHLHVEERLREIRETVNLDRKATGQNSYGVLATAVPVLIDICESLITKKNQMLQERAALTKEADKIWELCDRHVQDKDGLRQRMLGVQSENRDLEEANKQLMQRLNSTIDLALGDDTHWRTKSSAGSSRRESLSGGPQYAPFSPDASLEAKYMALNPGRSNSRASGGHGLGTYDSPVMRPSSPSKLSLPSMSPKSSPAKSRQASPFKSPKTPTSPKPPTLQELLSVQPRNKF